MPLPLLYIYHMNVVRAACRRRFAPIGAKKVAEEHNFSVPDYYRVNI